MTRNFVTNGSRTRTLWYRGHNSYLVGNSLYTVAGYFGQTKSFIEGLGQTLDVEEASSTGSLSIPSDAASVWIWMPQAAFDASDIAAINTYLAGGGRVILIGENNFSGFDLANQRVQELMAALGSAGIYRDGCLSGNTSTVADDPLMVDVASITSACTSHFTPGVGDAPLVNQGGQPIVMRLRLGPPVLSSVVAPVITSLSVLGRAAAEMPAGWDPAVGPPPSEP